MFFSVSEQTKNPNAVINALKTFEHSIKRTDHNKYIGANSMEDITEEDDDEDSDKSRSSSMVETTTPTSPSTEEAASEKNLDNVPTKEVCYVCNENVNELHPFMFTALTCGRYTITFRHENVQSVVWFQTFLEEVQKK